MSGPPDVEWEVGSRIRIMPIDGGGPPLWDEEGKLPDEPDFVEGFLGIPRELNEQLCAWNQRWEDLGGIADNEWLVWGESLRLALAEALGDDF
ncbi:MAG: hypothetical protein ACRCYQ_05640, partial [Nocardioides sp.]